MSTEANEPVESQEVNLDDFEKDFFTPETEEVNTEVEEDTDSEDRDVKEETNEEEDTHEDDGASDTPATDDDDDEETDEVDEDEEETPTDSKPQKKNRAQERIEELNAKFREAERRAIEAEAKLAERERAKLEQNKDSEPEPVKTEKADTGPSEDDLNEDGTPKYPLGQFDPQYMKDVIQHALDQDRAARAEEAKQTEAQKAAQAEAEALSASWNQKLDPAKERYPDFEEKGQALIDSFSDLDQDYGEYLTTVLMSMDHGPDVLYYLSSNPDEAKTIVDSGAQKATIALGRIEAQFMGDETETKNVTKKKVSKAPDPPPKVKGTSATKMSLDATSDNVNLDALAKELAKGGQYS